MDYTEKPPSFGQHYDTPAPFTKRFYTMQDRPAVETLVHNLEHGYTIAWYRADAPADQITALENASKTFTASEFDINQKFIAAPWAAADGAGFPEGKNVVLARWTADPNNPSDTATQRASSRPVARSAARRSPTSWPSTRPPTPRSRTAPELLSVAPGDSGPPTT